MKDEKMKDSLDDELKNISPWLRDMKRPDDGFKIPEGYFDTLEDRVFARIEAALFCAVLAAVWLLRPQPQAEMAAVDLSVEDVEDYVLENVHDFDENQLASIPDEGFLEANESPATPAENSGKAPSAGDEFSPEDVEKLLNDMSDEELESIL